jgi:hypothetical protein
MDTLIEGQTEDKQVILHSTPKPAKSSQKENKATKTPSVRLTRRGAKSKL